MHNEKLELTTETQEKPQKQKQSKIVFQHPQAGNIAIKKLEDESVEIIVNLEHGFIFSKTELLLVEDLKENRCLDLRN